MDLSQSIMDTSVSMVGRTRGDAKETEGRRKRHLRLTQQGLAKGGGGEGKATSSSSSSTHQQQALTAEALTALLAANVIWEESHHRWRVDVHLPSSSLPCGDGVTDKTTDSQSSSLPVKGRTQGENDGGGRGESGSLTWVSVAQHQQALRLQQQQQGDKGGGGGGEEGAGGEKRSGGGGGKDIYFEAGGHDESFKKASLLKARRWLRRRIVQGQIVVSGLNSKGFLFGGGTAGHQNGIVPPCPPPASGTANTGGPPPHPSPKTSPHAPPPDLTSRRRRSSASHHVVTEGKTAGAPAGGGEEEGREQELTAAAHLNAATTTSVVGPVGPRGAPPGSGDGACSNTPRSSISSDHGRGAVTLPPPPQPHPYDDPYSSTNQPTLHQPQLKQQQEYYYDSPSGALSRQSSIHAHSSMQNSSPMPPPPPLPSGYDPRCYGSNENPLRHSSSGSQQQGGMGHTKVFPSPQGLPFHPPPSSFSSSSYPSHTDPFSVGHTEKPSSTNLPLQRSDHTWILEGSSSSSSLSSHRGALTGVPPAFSSSSTALAPSVPSSGRRTPTTDNTVLVANSSSGFCAPRPGAASPLPPGVSTVGMAERPYAGGARPHEVSTSLPLPTTAGEAYAGGGGGGGGGGVGSSVPVSSSCEGSFAMVMSGHSNNAMLSSSAVSPPPPPRPYYYDYGGGGGGGRQGGNKGGGGAAPPSFSEGLWLMEESSASVSHMSLLDHSSSMMPSSESRHGAQPTSSSTSSSLGSNAACALRKDGSEERSGDSRFPHPLSQQGEGLVGGQAGEGRGKTTMKRKLADDGDEEEKRRLQRMSQYASGEDPEHGRLERRLGGPGGVGTTGGADDRGTHNTTYAGGGYRFDSRQNNKGEGRNLDGLQRGREGERDAGSAPRFQPEPSPRDPSPHAVLYGSFGDRQDPRSSPSPPSYMLPQMASTARSSVSTLHPGRQDCWSARSQNAPHPPNSSSSCREPVVTMMMTTDMRREEGKGGGGVPLDNALSFCGVANRGAGMPPPTPHLHMGPPSGASSAPAPGWGQGQGGGRESSGKGGPFWQMLSPHDADSGRRGGEGRPPMPTTGASPSTGVVLGGEPYHGAYSPYPPSSLPPASSVARTFGGGRGRRKQGRGGQPPRRQRGDDDGTTREDRSRCFRTRRRRSTKVSRYPQQ